MSTPAVVVCLDYRAIHSRPYTGFVFQNEYNETLRQSRSLIAHNTQRFPIETTLHTSAE